MDRQALEAYIRDTYSADAEHPWPRYPEYVVFRHAGNRKWFAVIMTVTQDKLGFANDAPIHILNLKTDPVLLGSLLKESGFFPAYHMSKTSWVSVALDGSADEEKLRWLLDLSYDLTGPKCKQKRIK